MPPLHFQIEGDVYYITIVTYDRLPVFSRPSFIVPLLDSLNFYRHKLQFKLLGYVIMPDHIHLLIWPNGAATIPDIMRDYKVFTAKRLIRQAEVENCQDWLSAFARFGSATERSDNKVWQDSYWDQTVFTVRVLRQKLNYIHRNPVRAGLVTDPTNYPYSSFRNYELGEDWLIEIDREWL